ncbi:MAG TPA: PPK2 family polyphosphate kinase [Jiangellales bacterium]|nr:PPK2 family polyphosphate kinase [Jiangellales bacterium]
MGKGKKDKRELRRLTDRLRLPPGPVDLAAVDTRATPGFDGGKQDGKAALADLKAPLSDLQERLFAHGRSGGQRRLLLVVQGMDTSGKGGTVRHAVGLMDPQGVSITSFKAPTAEERRRGFLWRIRQALPEPGMVGVFDRSHYEDVLIARVRGLARPSTIERRYEAINEFEAKLVADDCIIIKAKLHLSHEEQRDRLVARLDDHTKHWKYNPGDVEERKHWPAYQEAYEIALERCNTEAAPWYVIPADRKWYRNWAVTRLLIEHLEAMSIEWPAADYDIRAERERVLAT